MPITGGTPVSLTVPASVAELGVLVVDDSNLYCGSTTGVVRVPTNGGTATVLAPGKSGANGIAVDANYVYWTTPDGYVKKLPK